jgi:hypothetical protein
MRSSDSGLPWRSVLWSMRNVRGVADHGEPVGEVSRLWKTRYCTGDPQKLLVWARLDRARKVAVGRSICDRTQREGRMFERLIGLHLRVQRAVRQELDHPAAVITVLIVEYQRVCRLCGMSDAAIESHAIRCLRRMPSAANTIPDRSAN